MFFTTGSFRREVRDLTKKVKFLYCSCLADIKDDITERSFDSLWDSPFLIYEDVPNQIRIQKLRVKNSQQNSGEAGGFRLIATFYKANSLLTSQPLLRSASSCPEILF